jgi:hypothetical protein
VRRRLHQEQDTAGPQGRQESQHKVAPPIEPVGRVLPQLVQAVRGNDEVEVLSLGYAELFELRTLCDYLEIRVAPLDGYFSSKGERLFAFVYQKSLSGPEDIRRE